MVRLKRILAWAVKTFVSRSNYGFVAKIANNICVHNGLRLPYSRTRRLRCLSGRSRCMRSDWLRCGTSTLLSRSRDLLERVRLGSLATPDHHLMGTLRTTFIHAIIAL